MVNVNIIDVVQQEKYWRLEPVRYYMSGHMYRNSPYETDDSCGNCNGANCDWCKKVTVNPELRFSIPTDELYNILISKGLSKYDASEIAYSDYRPKSEYHLIWPTDEMLKEANPELHEKFITVEDSINEAIENYKPKYDYFRDVRKQILLDNKVGEYDYDNHIYKQLDMYWAYHENELMQYFKEKRENK